MSPIVSVDQVSHWYASRGEKSPLHVLDDVSLEVEEGEFLAIVGPSGCGKSSLLRLIAGLSAPTAGSISLAGQPITGPNRGVAVVFQGFELLPWRTVVQNVSLGLETQGIGKRERYQRARDSVQQVGLEGFEHQYPHELSGGMQQRVGLARALLVDPKVLLMDEPFGALDALTRDRMQREVLHMLEERGKTVVFITHDIKEATYLADRVIVMSTRPAVIVREVPVTIERPRWNRRLAVEHDSRFADAEAVLRKELGLEDMEASI